MKPLKFITEAIGWVQIAASPILGGGIIGFLVYLWMGNTTGAIIGIAIALLGLVLGVVWATRVWKKKGTVQFMSKVMATPELDEDESK